MILPDAGTVDYNGYTFDGASHVTIKCEPVMDDAMRIIIYHRYIVTVRSIIGDANSTDAEMAAIRALLTKQGQELRIYDKGFGTLHVNGSGVRDVAFGPIPKILSWKPIGSFRAAEIEWSCETSIAYCYSPLSAYGIIAWNYGVDYSLDVMGLTRRTISGYLEIALNRTTTGSRTIPDTADAYRDLIKPAIPPRFERRQQTYRLSPDKRRLDFTIVDSEIKSNNPYPLGVVNIDATHRVTWSRRGGGASTMRNRIEVRVEMAPDQELLNAYAVFYAIADRRLTQAKISYANGILIDDLSVEEDIFGHEASFAIGYRVLTSLQNLLTSTGLWVLLGTNTWTQWAASVSAISDTRGYANLYHMPTNDAIIDPCGGAPMVLPEVGYLEPTQPQWPLDRIANEYPPPEVSWLEYDSYVEPSRERPVIRLSILQLPDDDDPNFNEQETRLFYPPGAGSPDTFQKGGQGRYSARLIGRAYRAGYPIPKPATLSVGQATAVETGGRFASKIVANWLGVPIYGAAWDIEYGLDKSPEELTPPANIQQGVTTNGQANQPIGY